MEIPFTKEPQQLTVLSYGIGQDSTAILLKLIHDKDFFKKNVKGKLIVVSADTKNEHPKTDLYLKYITEICKKEKIPFYHLDPENYATGHWKGGLIGFYKAHDAVGSKAFPKTCTDNLKIRPIYKFLEYYIHREFETTSYGKKKAFWEYFHKYGKVRVLIGIAKDEETRASENGSTGIKWFDQCVEKIYPLLPEGMNRKACQDYINSLGYKVPPPSNCILCPFMSLQELLYMYRYLNDHYLLWVELEKKKLKKNEHKESKNLTVWGTLKTLPEMVEVAIEKYGSMTKEDLEDYKFSHGHCVKSKY